MPNVFGCRGQDVLTALNRSDHRGRILQVPSSTAAGVIVDQTPQENSPLQSNTPIVLSVSDGAQPPAPTTYIAADRVADVTASVKLSPNGPYRAGQTVTCSMFVENFGPSNATRVMAEYRLFNLRLLETPVNCRGARCTVVDLAPRTTATIELKTEVVRSGPFNCEVNSTHGERDSNPSNNGASSGGVADAEQQPVTTTPDTSPSSTNTAEPPIHPQKPEPSRTVDIRVTNSLVSNGPFTAGDRVAFLAAVDNVGQLQAESVQVSFRLKNLHLLRVGGICKSLQCRIEGMPAGRGVKIEVQASVIQNGAFEATVEASSPQIDSYPTNNSMTAAGIATAVTPTHLAAIVASVLSIFVVAALAVFVRRAWWRSHVKVQPSMDLTGESNLLGVLPVTYPPISVQVHLEDGRAGPLGTIPIERRSDSDR